MKRHCLDIRRGEEIAQYVSLCCLKVKMDQGKHIWIAAGKLFAADVFLHIT
jgi:hypothetical protein